MSTFTLPELIAKLRECAGDSDTYDLDTDDVIDVPFLELGYDSLALLQVTGVLDRELGIELSDDEVAAVETPRLFLGLVNDALGLRAA
ncbi:acyl carrier protein [Streptomyces sp. NPDC005828]|uniref:acyl carrier protein n=1 Tax=Streptomyces sp. NPDC005828 TaxID=3157071 RepID=UPI0033FEC7AC